MGANMSLTVILSDLHLGLAPYSITAANRLLPAALEGLGGPELHLVLNGDTFDFLMDDGPLDLALALARSQALLDHNRETVDQLRQMMTAGASVTIRLGNHDPELALDEVQNHFREKIHHKLAFDNSPKWCPELGGVRVMVSHGALVDDWNRFDHSALGSGSGFRFPPGSELVKSFLNPAKLEYGLRFLDLLKPEFEAAVLTTLLVHPNALALLARGGELAQIRRRLRRRANGEAYALTQREGPSSVLAELAPVALRELSDYIDQAGEEHALFGVGGGWTHQRRARLLRCLLAPFAKAQRWVVGEKGNAYFSFEPETSEWTEAEELVAQSSASVAIIGHTHAARFGTFGGLTLINTGTWAELLRPPAPEAPVSDWTTFLMELQEDPKLAGVAQHRVLVRPTAAFLAASENGLEVSLRSWSPQDKRWNIEGSQRIEPSRSAPLALAQAGDTAVGTNRHFQVRVEALKSELDDNYDDLLQVGEVVPPGAHRDALIDVAREALRLAIEQNGDGKSRTALEHLAQAHAVWDLYLQARAQRRDYPGLRAVDRIAESGYTSVLKRAHELELRVANRRLPCPMAWLQPDIVPVTFPRGRQVLAPSLRYLKQVRLPFPVVLLPHDYLQAPWWLTSVLHEVGHDLDHDLGLTPLVKRHLGAALGDKHERKDAWLEWIPEILADLFGLALAGPAYASSLLQIAAPIVGLDTTLTSVGTHPPLLLRLALLSRFTPPLLGTNPGLTPPGDVGRFEKRYLDDLDVVCGSVLGTRLTPCVVLTELLQVASGGWKSLPGQVQSARDNGADDDFARRLFHSKATTLVGSEWTLQEQHLDYVRAGYRKFSPTILDQPGSLHKVPPLALLAFYDEIHFVGSDNSQLAPRIREAFKLRKQRKWTAITLYFLNDPGMDALYGASAAERKRDRDTASAELETLLNADLVSGSVTIRYHESTDLYGSFWSKGTHPEIHQRVHLAPKLWGVDLRQSPAIDFVSGPGNQNPQLEACWKGLEHILQNSTATPKRN